MATISLDFDVTNDAKIAVVGCGGAGGNALNTMIEEGLQFVNFIAINTDSQALSQNRSPMKIQIGQKTRKGLGCGARPECGYVSAEEDEERIREVLEGNDMVFITAGLGGGTGTGSAPVVARIAKEMEILTVGVVTKPFNFEGKMKTKLANHWIESLREYVDSLIVISNQKIIETAGNVSFLEGFKRADSVLMSAVSGIADAITETGMINIDFADVKTILQSSGQALIGVGYGSGENKVLEAVKQAIENPLIENLTIEGAGAILVNYRMGPDTTNLEIDEATNYITKNAHEDAVVVIGMVLDMELQSDAKVTIVATRFEDRIEQISLNEPIMEQHRPKQPTQKQTPPPLETAVIEPEIEIPVQEQIQQDRKAQLNVNLDHDTGIIGIDRENLDIPTWIRKKRNKITQNN